MNSEILTVRTPDGIPVRADRFIASLGMFSRSQIARRSVRIFLGDKELKPSRKLGDGETVRVEWDNPPSTDILPEDIPLDICYEDEDCLVINKQHGMVVHPAHGHLHGTLVQALLRHCRGLEEAFDGDRSRSGIVHRLDKDTSGLIIAARHPEALETLSEQFRSRSVKKTYLAVVKGCPPRSRGEIDKPIGRSPVDRKKFTVDVRNAKSALSRYRVLCSSDTHSLVQVRILTGRTHQIRVHMKHIGCPVLGDPIYSHKDPALPEASLMLHSWKLAIYLPAGMKKRFEAPLPEHFLRVLELLKLSLPKECLR